MGSGAEWRLPVQTGAVWLDLVATVSKAYGAAPIERLHSAGRYATWLADEGLRPDTAPTGADLAAARELREALRRLALATLAGQPWAAADVAAVNRALAADRPLALETSGAVRPPGTAAEALARIARRAAEDLAGPAAATLGRCADTECGMLYLDPAGRRRWCSAELCGVRNRVRAHRRRLQQPAP
ncbi:MAG: CGNR zinc finger domain-containing protein [Mycobacteriales bacterium]